MNHHQPLREVIIYQLDTSSMILDDQPILEYFARNARQQFWLSSFIIHIQGCLNIHAIHMTANNSTNDIVVFLFVSDLKREYYTNYYFSITMP